MSLPAPGRGNPSRRMLTLLLLALAIFAELSGSGYALTNWIAEPQAPSYFATASLLLCLAAVVQFRMACSIFRGSSNPAGLSVADGARVLFVSGCSSYGLGLILGPVAGIGLLCVGCFALLGSITLLPLAAKPQTVDEWRKLVQSKRPRRVGLAVYHALLALVATEALLRGHRLLEGAALFRSATAGEAALDVQCWADAPQARPGVLRVAIVEGLTADPAPAM